MNKARVISKNVNNIYLIDPTINEYEINYYIKNNIMTENIDKISQIIEKIIFSTDKEVVISNQESYYFEQQQIQVH